MMELCRATAAERARGLPGDELIREPVYSATHAVSIAAPPAGVWPWLAQMGAGRGGWYSYDWIDNRGHRSAERIIAELQTIARGDVIPALPGATDAFIVGDVEPGRHLVLTVPAPGRREPRATWVLALEPNGPGTRLLVRARLSYLELSLPWLGRTRVAASLVSVVASPVHLIMQRRQLLGIRRRAEGRARQAV